MTDTQTPDATPEAAPEEQSQTFTQADVDRIVADRLKRERETTGKKYADYDALKVRASTADSLEQRVAEIEARAQKAETDALRARFAADVPERLRPLLTGTTEEELSAQRDLIVESESERKKNGNHAPREGTTPQAKDDPMRQVVHRLFAQAD